MDPLTKEESAWLRRSKRWIWIWRVSEAVGVVACASIIGALLVVLARGGSHNEGLTWATFISWVALMACWGASRLATSKIREIGDPP